MQIFVCFIQSIPKDRKLIKVPGRFFVYEEGAGLVPGMGKEERLHHPNSFEGTSWDMNF
jgi:hypothetical protein